LRSDLDRLMRERGLSGLVVLAHDRYSPAFYWCTGQKIHHGLYVCTADGNAHLVVDPMERDQAALTGGEWSTYAQHGFLAMLKNAESQPEAFAKLVGKLAGELRLEGKVAFLGEASLGFSWSMLSHLKTHAPSLVVDGTQPDVIYEAMETKEESELEKIRKCSRGAVDAMQRVAKYLGSLKPLNGHLTDGTRDIVRLKDVRALIHRTFAEHGLAEDGESIVAMGRDSGVPHNRGNDGEAIRAGETIIVDIFPGEAGGGYHTDMTRTFCIGPAPAAVKKMYAECRDSFDTVMAAMKGGGSCRSYQEMTCDVLEKHGHATLRTDAATTEGYVHGLGHGVGLAVHEGPRLGGPPSNVALLQPGHVVSVEPGLYYPSRGMGCRIEDLVAVRADGTIENLTPCSYELEVGPLD